MRPASPPRHPLLITGAAPAPGNKGERYGDSSLRGGGWRGASRGGFHPGGGPRRGTRENDMWIRRFAAGAAAVLAAGVVTPAGAVTEIQWWHAMTGANNDVIVKLANEFTAAQADYKVVPTYKGGYPDTMNAGIAAFRAGND